MTYDIALYGLGVMGSSLAKNLLDKGYKVALYNRNYEVSKKFQMDSKESDYIICSTEEELLSVLKKPRKIILMITAGEPVDTVIDSLLPQLDAGDILLDGGNSYYKDTSRRYNYLLNHNVNYLGVGISGGEEGALTGPSIMVGGSQEGWNKTKDILNSIAAYHEGIPCCNYFGKEGSGHYIKMVHNGIEYAQLQLIAETYFIMKNALFMSHEDIVNTFTDWKTGQLKSYLMDISVLVLNKLDEDGEPLVEKILDIAEQKGTGKWTVKDSIDRGIYIPTIYEATLARNFSEYKSMRVKGSEILSSKYRSIDVDIDSNKLKDTLVFGMISCFAQGISLIEKASKDNGWEIDMSLITKVWSNGCIIKSSMLSDINKAIQEKDENILLSETFRYVKDLEQSVRDVVLHLQQFNFTAPGILSTLNYYNYLCMDKMPVNFVQGLRDCFGAHKYKRVDAEGYHHTIWE